MCLVPSQKVSYISWRFPQWVIFVAYMSSYLWRYLYAEHFWALWTMEKFSAGSNFDCKWGREYINMGLLPKCFIRATSSEQPIAQSYLLLLLHQGMFNTIIQNLWQLLPSLLHFITTDPIWMTALWTTAFQAGRKKWVIPNLRGAGGKSRLWNNSHQWHQNAATPMLTTCTYANNNLLINSKFRLSSKFLLSYLPKLAICETF